MKPTVYVILGPFIAATTAVAEAAGQTSLPAASQGPAPAGNMTEVMLGFVALIAVCAMIAVVVKLVDLKRKRADEAVAVEAKIAEAFLTNPALSHWSIAPTAHRGLSRHSPVTIDIHGRLPSPPLREEAMATVTREASRTGMPFLVEDHIVVDPLMAEHDEPARAR